MKTPLASCQDSLFLLRTHLSVRVMREVPEVTWYPTQILGKVVTSINPPISARGKVSRTRRWQHHHLPGQSLPLESLPLAFVVCRLEGWSQRKLEALNSGSIVWPEGMHTTFDRVNRHMVQGKTLVDSR
jgi:hypothetical protein